MDIGEERRKEPRLFSLCYRCEHRANFLERGSRPRHECGDITHSSGSCYMFKPVRPIVVAPSDKRDKRPWLGPPILSSRSKSLGVCDEVGLEAFPVGEGLCLYWSPKNKEEKEND